MKVRYTKIDYLCPGSINYSKVNEQKEEVEEKEIEGINQMRTEFAIICMLRLITNN